MKGFQHGKAEGQARRCSVDPGVDDALMDVSRGPTADHLAYTMLKMRSIKESTIVIDTALANKLQGCYSSESRTWGVFEMKVIHSCVLRKQLCLSQVVASHGFLPRLGVVQNTS